jgi:hypothetical protein
VVLTGEGELGQAEGLAWVGKVGSDGALGARRSTGRVQTNTNTIHYWLSLITVLISILHILQETDKASIDVEAQDEGIVAKLIVRSLSRSSCSPVRR